MPPAAPPTPSGGLADQALAQLPPKKAFNTKWEVAKFVWSQTPWAKARQIAKIPAQMSREGLKELAGYVPAGTEIASRIKSPALGNTAAVVLGGPRVAAETVAEFAPTFIDPDTLAIQGGGRILGNAAASPVGQKVVGAVARRIPTAVKRAFTYRFGQPAAYQEAAEGRMTAVQNAGEDAVEVGSALQKGLSNAKQLRTGQILRGGVSVSERELPLRLRANYARQALDKLEAEAKALDLIPPNALANYTRKELAAFRNKKAALDARIKALRAQARSELPVMKPGGKEGEPYALFAYTEQLSPKLPARHIYNIFGDPAKMPPGVGHGSSQTADFLRQHGIPIKGIEPRAIERGWRPPATDLPPGRLQPAARREVRGLERESQGIQDEIVRRYTNAGQKYMPRLYMKHELPEEVSAKFGYKNMRVIRDRFKKRGDLPENLRMQMGEIKQPAYPVAKGLAQTSEAVETTKLYNRVAANPKWTSQVPREGFVELPKTKNYGSLAGKHVHPEIARDITEMNAAPSTASKMYDNFISKWKFGKVVLNPATHFRNMMSNSILADLGGMGHGDQVRLLPKAADEVIKRGPLYEQARKLGLIGGEFFGSEIQAFRDNLLRAPGQSMMEKAVGVAGNVGNKIGRAYQAEEQVFKLGKFMHNLEKGMTPKAAAADAEKWLFNYGKVAPAVKTLRKSPLGAPFITFSAKALPRVAEAMASNPVRFYKYIAFVKAMDKVAKDRLGLSDDDIKIIKRNTRGQSMILPIKDKTGAPYVLDLSYILPWGDVGEQGGMFGLPPAAPPAGPLKAVLEAGMNKNQFTGQQIYDPETDTRGEKVAKVTDFLGKTLAPSWMPGFDSMNSPFKGGYSFQKMKAALKKRPDYFGRVRPMSAAIADTVFGIKASPVSPSEKLTFEMVNKKRALDDLVRQTGSKMRHPGISPEEKKLIMKRFSEKYQRLMKEPMPR